ncbi:hypothetical protein [Vibrio ezurae]|uniref:DNA gyrase subunit B n=1 Tax=Vibrio ezurae NBRC 102218 TaxID=1219080 RepID=U3B4M4_9VIBR|nr:hypothetical protein [Vibrio ezurae]GAD80392.1 hypothetical protein VEZ01S_35_00130 [Vibrio ezurae NBRC 102218]
MRQLLTILSAVVLLAYPFAVYFGIDRFGFSIVGILLILALGVRLLSVQKTKLKELKYVAQISAVTGISLVGLGLIFKQHGWLTFYPVVVNLCMLVVFASSLKQPQTIIERLARLQDPDLPQSGVDYTRKVTQIWCVFFISNGLFALYTCFHSLQLWTLYNGLISYILAGSLFAIEWIVRQFLLKDRKKK